MHNQLLNANIAARAQSKRSSDGLALTRAAFAVMVKMNPDLSAALEDIVDAIDLHSGEQVADESGVDAELSWKSFCLEQPQYELLRKVWVQAAKMYSWLHSKTASIARKFDDIQESEAREQREQEHLQLIVSRILQKAEFLIKLNPPRQFAASEQKNIAIQKTPSYVNSSMPIQFIKQTSSQQHSSQTTSRLNVEKQDAATQSVLSCLQAPVLCEEIMTQVEHNYLSAVRRYSGLYLLNGMLRAETTRDEYIGIVRCLREIQVDGEGVKHFMDDIQGGCNENVDACIRKIMFEILGKLARRLQVTKCQDEAYELIYALHWQYRANDFQMLLENVNIFALIAGKDMPESLMASAWGKLHTECERLRDDLTLSFTEVFLTILARISDTSIDTRTQLKVHGNSDLVSQVPSLRRVKSVLDEDSSSLLVDSAMRVVFRTFDTICRQNQQL